MEFYHTGDRYVEEVQVPKWSALTDSQKEQKLMEWARSFYSLRYNILEENDTSE